MANPAKTKAAQAALDRAVAKRQACEQALAAAKQAEVAAMAVLDALLRPPAPPVTASGATAPDGTPLGALLFEETWTALDFWDPKARTGRWSTTSWPNELVGAGWDNIGQSPGYSHPGQKTHYVNRAHALAQRVQPWRLGAGYVDLIATPTPADLADLCGKQPVVSGSLDTFPSFGFTYGYVEFDCQLITASPPPWGGLWPAAWLRPRFYNVDVGTYGGLTDAQKDLPETDTCEVMDPLGLTTTATFHRAVNGVRNYEAHVLAYPKGDVRDRHKYQTLRTPQWEITWVDGVEVGRRAMTPDAAVPQHLVINMGMGGDWPERNGQYPLNLAQAPWTWRCWPIRVWALK